MLYNVAANSEQTDPNCQNIFPLDFSIYTFEHLKVRGTLLFTEKNRITIYLHVFIFY